MKQNIITTKMFENAKEYWSNKLSGQLVELNLSADFPKTKEYQEAYYKETFENELAEMLIHISKNVDLSLYTLLLTFFKILLHKLTDQNDIAIATSTLENSSQNFNKCIILRDILWPEMTFKELLMNIKHTVTQGYKNQYYPVRKLMKLLKIVKGFSLFKIIFLLENIHKKQFVKDLAHDYGNDIIFSVTKKDNQITSNIVYNTKLFKKETIQKLFDCYCFILTQVLNDTSLKISHINILSEEEKKKIIFNFNNTKTVYPRDKTINELFTEQVKKTPGKFAIVSIETKFTYKELDEKSNQLASSLKMKGVKPGDIVGIMLERSPELMVTLLAILKAGAVYLPIDPNYPEDRKKYMLKDSGAKVLLTIQETASIPPSTLMPFYHSYPSNLAYIIYTSGSTGTPKGVMVTHRNIARLVKQAGYMDLNENDRLLMTGLPVFDISTFEIWAPLLNGLTLYLADDDTIFDADKLGKTLAENKISILHLIPQLFNQLAPRDIEIFNGLRYLMVGGDMVRPTYINTLRNKYKKINILHMYGPTENTTFSTSFLVDKEYDRRIPLGKPINNSTVFLFNKMNQLQPPGVAGELCTGGDGVARGYLNNPELTHEKFIYNPYNPEERLYKTGDLARWLPDGNIAFLGRCDQQLKVRGNRIEPGEIENRLLKYNHVTEAVVISKDNEEGEKYLIAYVAADEELNTSKLHEYLVHQLPTYMIPSYFVQLDQFPLNHNGKIDRKALPEPKQEKSQEYIAPGNPIEKKLVELWQQVLERDYIGVMDNFFTLGGNSLKATILVSKIHKEFNVKIPLAEIFKKPVIQELSRYIRVTEIYRYSAINPGEQKEYYALSSPQKRLYVLQHMDLNSTVYNIPMVLTLAIEIEKEKLGVTFHKLISRHDSLRTSFIMIQEEPVQRVHQEVKFAIEYYQAQGEETPDIIEKFIRPFDLSENSLLRVGLISTGESKPLLLVDIHHIIADGISNDILSGEFYSLYSEEELSPIKVQYKDYSEWQKSKEYKKAIKFQETYWVNKFSDELPVLDLPTDYPRPSLQNFAGKEESFTLNNPRASALKDMAKKSGVTLYMYILAVFNVFLAKLTGKEDIIIGTPIAARRHPDLEKIVGMFVNTLVIRNCPLGHQTFNQFLKNVKAETLEAYENQEYQFEDLVNKLDLNRETGRNPLFDVSFTLGNINSEPQLTPPKETQESKTGQYNHEHKISKFDLTLKCMDRGNHLAAAFEYPVTLFKKETIQRFVKYFRELVLSITTHPAKRIADLGIIPPQEKKQILVELNDTKAEYPQNKTLDELFAGQVEKTPDNIAVIDQAEIVCTTSGQASQSYLALTYRELHKKAHQLAYYLMAEGVRPGMIAGIMARRSVEMIIGILGILKSGGAYLPIDLHCPRERIQYMLKDSNAKVLLTTRELSGTALPGKKILYLEKLHDPAPVRPLSKNSINPEPVVNSANIAYVIYTSGSTGNPKGVMVEHRSVVNYTCWAARMYVKGESLNFPFYTAIAFDLTVTSIFTPLSTGNSVIVFIDELLPITVEKIEKILQDPRIGAVKLTPAHLKIIKERGKEGISGSKIKRFIVGGEELKNSLAREIHEIFNGKIEIYNEYGPTEATIGCMIHRYQYTPEKEKRISVPIGTPADNARVYILDRYQQPSPVGVSGELYIAGDCLARGYLNNPELTAEKFLPVLYRFYKSYRSYMTYISKRTYKTGDLARWLQEGSIEFAGRIDRQVKIRGYRIEPEEIENQLLKHDNIKEAIVTSRNSSYEKIEKDDSFCAYFVSNRDLDTLELREFLSENLPEYMIPNYFVPLAELPLTPNGKLDMKTLPAPTAFIEAKEGYKPPQNETMEKLIEIWAEVLGIEKNKIGIDDNFFELGGHSLKAIIVFAKIHKKLSARIPLAEIFKTPTIKGLAGYIKKADTHQCLAIETVEQKEYYALSSAQLRLYFLQQTDLNNTGYNISKVLILEGEIDAPKIAAVFKKLLKRHESLRTSFEIIGEDAVQRIHACDKVEFEIEYYEINNNEGQMPGDFGLVPAPIIYDFIRPFVLSRAPLLRVGLIKITEKKHIFMVDLHHIISDGVSCNLVEKEFTALYSWEDLPALKLQYKDFAGWQNKLFASKEIKQQEKYWLEQFTGEITHQDIPTDYNRPAVQSFAGSIVEFEIDKELAEKIKQIISGTGTTLFMFLLAVYNIFLSVFIGKEDILVGSPVSGRNHNDLQNVVGMFINMLPMRNYPGKNKTFVEFLSEVKENSIQALENQDYQFEQLVTRLDLKKDHSRNPLLDVVFSMQNLDANEIETVEIEIKPYQIQRKIAKFDLMLFSVENKNNNVIHMALEYKTALFSRSTVEKMSKYYIGILKQVTDDKNIKIGDISITHDLIAANKNILKEDHEGFMF